MCGAGFAARGGRGHEARLAVLAAPGRRALRLWRARGRGPRRVARRPVQGAGGVMEPRPGVVTGLDLRVHLYVEGGAFCGALDELASLMMTDHVEVVTCSACLAAPLMRAAS